jgi:hypothetical protein
VLAGKEGTWLVNIVHSHALPCEVHPTRLYHLYVRQMLPAGTGTPMHCLSGCFFPVGITEKLTLFLKILPASAVSVGVNPAVQDMAVGRSPTANFVV